MRYIFEEIDNKKDEKYLVIKGCEDFCRKLVIPEKGRNNPPEKISNSKDAEGDSLANTAELPVKVIGNHAFSSRKDLVDVVIPDSIHTILGFAFHNCGNLKRITLTDSVQEYLDGGTRQCESLEEIEVFIKNDNNYIIRRILEDNDRRLTFRIHMKDGEALLVFPGFNYDFVENTMARTIQFAIEGTGYAYRECVKSDLINIREYDNLFSKVSADDKGTAEMIAMARLLKPYELSEEARVAYEKWLCGHALKSLTKVVKELDLKATDPIGTFYDYFRNAEEHIAFYLDRGLLDKGEAGELAHIAADRGITAIVSMLMNYAENDRNETTGDSSVKKENDNSVIKGKGAGILELDF